MINRLFENKRMSIQQSSYVWNTCAGMVFGFQSVFLLMVITRVLGLYDAGIFTIAYANANLFLTIGKYGMRNYQATDVRGQFSFQEYVGSRVFTVLAMVAVSVGYTLIAGHALNYTVDKILVILFMCLLKTEDALEDVYLGWYQLKGRLDVGARIMALRLISTLLVWIAGMILLRSLLYSLIIAVVYSGALLFWMIRGTLPYFQIEKRKANFRKIWKLLMLCLPLSLGSFLSFYIGNAPKYAIDAQLTDEIQACYGFIAMPVFVIGLLNSFVYQPILTKLAIFWREERYEKFIRRVLLECVVVAGITLFALTCGYLLGVPVLSWMYHTDLAPYKAELLILLLGGGFLALSGFLQVVLTTIRRQKSSVVGYLIVAILALFLSSGMVKKYGIRGAAVLYTTLMFVLSLIFALMIGFQFCRSIRKIERK